MRLSCRFLPLVWVLVVAIPVAPAGAGQKDLVLTSNPVIQAMAEVLLKGTSITPVNCVPAAYSMDGQQSYFKGHWQDFASLAAGARAVLTTTGAWSSDPLFPWARRADIRIVEIDVTRPLDGVGAGVPLITAGGKVVPQVWRSPANLSRMAGIAAMDLGRLYPGQRDLIQANAQKFQNTLFALRRDFEGRFLEMEIMDLAALTRDYSYLTEEFGLNIVVFMPRPSGQWTGADCELFTRDLRDSGGTVVVCPWPPEPRVARAIKEGGGVPVVLSRFVREPGSDPMNALTDWFGGNLSALIKPLNQQ